MIVPTVGRIVWFRPDAVFIPTLPGQPDGRLAAIVVGVQSAERVNLTVFGADGSMHPRTGVYLEQNEDQPAPGACCWMPFQKGQAGAADKASAVVADAGALQEALKGHVSDALAAIEARGKELHELLAGAEVSIKSFLTEGHDKLISAATHVENVVKQALATVPVPPPQAAPPLQPAAAPDAAPAPAAESPPA